MADLDEIIHQPLRLKIMAALNALPSAAPGLEFSRLKRLTGATDGNLGAHIENSGESRVRRDRKGVCGKKTADHRDSHSSRARRVRTPRRDAAGYHCRFEAAASGIAILRLQGRETRATDSLSDWLHRMHILLLGSGGREHALAWKIAASPLMTKLWCAPGSAGIAREAECVPIDITDHAAVIDFCKANAVDFVVVGPDAPIAAGIVDDLNVVWLQSVRTDESGGPTGKLEELHQGAVPRRAYSDRGV